MKNIILLIAVTFIPFYYSAQEQNNAFENFASKHDSIGVKAYEARDAKKFEKTLSEFLTGYNKLKTEEKETYSRYLSGLYYNLSCLYSLQNNITSAIANFEKAVKSGYKDYYHILEDTDLDNIRNETTYKKIVQSLKETNDYLYVLKRAEKYNTSDNRPFPAFTYQSADNPDLVTLKKAFNLDSIAGKGNDISKILNLLHWIHNLVPHDGSHGNPAVKNALNMISVCKKEGRGLNCRGLATVLNECYLAIGIKSRFITCLPKDSLEIDPDCHVINMVYSNSLKKWLWIDPTFDAYVMNETGTLLSIEEVRDRIINNKPLILNPDANWNHQSSQTKEYYLLNYMAKNLYILQCPVSSEYDTETIMPGKTISYVQLFPTEYYKQPKEKTTRTNDTNKTTHIIYPTNNPTLFWQAP